MGEREFEFGLALQKDKSKWPGVSAKVEKGALNNGLPGQETDVEMKFSIVWRRKGSGDND